MCFVARERKIIVFHGRIGVPPINHFDFLASIYDRVIAPADSSRLVELLDLPVQGVLLDAGGGTGRVSQTLVDQASQVIVADSSIPMLTKARLKHGLMPIGASTGALPFQENSIERIMVVDAYHHLANQLDSLSELWRVLTPNGRLIIEEPDIRIFGVKLVAFAEKISLMQSQFVHAEVIERHLQGLGASTSIVRDGYTYWVSGVKPTDN
jgi:demethylmenaquinone methyltransferase/2-methoxy-6-polyprenyl-1,4-benzoquinol methylase